MWRPVPDTMPAVAVCGSPNGEPMATASWPVRTVLESASTVRAAARSAPCRRGAAARSDERSTPRTSAVAVRSSANWICTRLELPTTWAFVTQGAVRVDHEARARSRSPCGWTRRRGWRRRRSRRRRPACGRRPRSRRAPAMPPPGAPPWRWSSRRRPYRSARARAPRRRPGRADTRPPASAARKPPMPEGGAGGGGADGPGRAGSGPGSGTRARRPSVGSPSSQSRGSVMAAAWAAVRQLGINPPRRPAPRAAAACQRRISAAASFISS